MMRGARSRGVERMTGWVGLLAAVLAIAGCQRGPQDAPPPRTAPMKVLTILTPHNETIRTAFEDAFWHWYTERHDCPVRVEWIYRGTPQCVDYVQSITHGRSEGARLRIPDVMFGGGTSDHIRLANAELSRTIDIRDAIKDIPAEVHGIATRDAEGQWYATGLSSFGILYNEAACRARGVAPPTTWSDLAKPEYYGWIALADPRASGSHRECLMLVLQHEGWDAGWSVVQRVLGNCRALNHRSGDALRQVQSGVSLATFAVNFDGMALAAESGGTLNYVDPPGATAATPDVISVLRTSHNEELATEFVRFVLSGAGQKLWGLEQGKASTAGVTLYHYPIDPTVYVEYPDRLSVSRNPLEEDFGLHLDPDAAAWQGRLLRVLVPAACGDGRHVALQQAWSRLKLYAPDHELLAQFLSPPFDGETARRTGVELVDDTRQEGDLIDELGKLFAERYETVMEKVAG